MGKIKKKALLITTDTRLMHSFRECNLIFISEGVTVGKLEDARVVVIVSVPVHGRLRGERRQLLFLLLVSCTQSPRQA